MEKDSDNKSLVQRKIVASPPTWKTALLLYKGYHLPRKCIVTIVYFKIRVISLNAIVSDFTASFQLSNSIFSKEEVGSYGKIALNQQNKTQYGLQVQKMDIGEKKG